MAQIPPGNFDQASAIPRSQPSRLDFSAVEQSGRGAQAIAEGIGNLAGVTGNMAIQQRAEEKRQADQLANAKAANALTQYEIAMRQQGGDFAQKLKSGEVSYDKAGDAWAEQIKNTPPPTLPDGASAVLAEHFNGGIQKIQSEAQLGVHDLARAAQSDDMLAQGVQLLDDSVKLFSMDKNIGRALDSIDAVTSGYIRKGGIGEQKAQELRDKYRQEVFGTDIKTRLFDGRDSIPALEKLKTDLTAKDGLYMATVDPTHRVGYTSLVQNQIDALNSAAEADANKRESAAKSVVGDVWKQAESGIPARPDDIPAWAAAVKGTKYEGAFIEAVKAVDQVQALRRMPLTQQTAWLTQREAELNKNGGTPDDWDHYKAIRGLLENDGKMRNEDPQRYLTNMTGKGPAQIDMKGLVTGDLSQVGRALQDRLDNVKALQASGYRVDKNVLTATEAQGLADAMNGMNPDTLSQLFGKLRIASGSAEIYGSIMDQIGQSEPIKAKAGTIAAYDTPGGNKIAGMLLRGEALLGKKDEGGTKYYAPSDKDMRSEFASIVGNAYQGRTDMENDYHAVRALYAAWAAQGGFTKAGDTLDAKLLKECVKSITGDLANIGGTRVPAPFGMTADRFEELAQQKIKIAMREAGHDPDMRVGLVSTDQPGLYVVMNGIVPVYKPKKNPNGRDYPVRIDFSPNLPIPLGPVRLAPTDGRH